MRTVRRMRHWKQRYAPDAKFIWNKPVLWQGEQVEIGAVIPDDLASSPNRLRRFWEARVIQLADFSAPDVLTGRTTESEVQGPPEPDLVDLMDADADPIAKIADRRWAIEGQEGEYTSKKAAQAALDAFREDNAEEPAEEDEDDPLET